MVVFGKWEFNSLNMSNAFPNYEGSVHLWQDSKDRMISVELQRYILKMLTWVTYHKHLEGGQLFLHVDGLTEMILKALLLGEEPYR